MDAFSYEIFRFSCSAGLIETRDKIIVSLSGGIDSMSLFRLLYDFREKVEIDLRLVHFHHGLRTESDDEEAFLRGLADEKGVPISVVEATHLKGKKDMQNRARQWRYRHLNQIMVEAGFNKIALGHHLNDLVETQIWKILRGGSLFSFNPMQESSPPYIRPLLNTPKEELRNYLLRIKQKWCEDPSNNSNDYTRNIIRNQLIPIMKQCSGGRLEEKFLALNRDSQSLKHYFDQLVSNHIYESDHIDYGTIAGLAPLFALELIHRFLIHHDQPEINRANIQRIYELVMTNRGNWSITLKNNRAVVGKNKKVRYVENLKPET
ncbi:MAG: tRNA lysidine(34) synthetase TilS [Proteobacteria bacterium]|nr:tRNA lysidine(34) synthetase TilS [Pseudomonadota bacterium]